MQARQSGLDLLRAFAIVWVMLFHAQVAGLGTPWLALTRVGWMGVDLFFVLSGFLISQQFFIPIAQGERPSLADFYIKRGFRILPAYLMVVLLYFALPDWRETPQIQPLWQFLSFTENLFINYFDAKAFSHVWSLCVEEHFYLILPLLCISLIGRVGPRGVLALVLAILLGGMCLRGGLWLALLEPVQQQTGPGNFFQRYMELIYYPSYSRMDGILAGVVLALIKVFRPQLWQRLMQRANWLMLAGMIGFALAWWVLQERMQFWPVVLGFPVLEISLALLVAASASPSSLLGSKSLPGAQGIAKMAFSLYLSHKLSYALVQRQWGEYLQANDYLAFVVYGGVAFALGYALYRLLELPSLQLRQRYFARTQVKPSLSGA